MTSGWKLPVWLLIVWVALQQRQASPLAPVLHLTGDCFHFCLQAVPIPVLIPTPLNYSSAFLKGHIAPISLRLIWGLCKYCRPLHPSGPTESVSPLVAPRLVFCKCSQLFLLVSPDSCLSALWFPLLADTRLISQSVTPRTPFPCHLKMGYDCVEEFLLLT